MEEEGDNVFDYVSKFRESGVMKACSDRKADLAHLSRVTKFLCYSRFQETH